MVRPAEATLEICGRMTNVRFPSESQLRALIGHVTAVVEAESIRKRLRKVPNYIVDVGANVGALSLLFHKIFPTADILALEPIEINYRYLLYNTQHFPKINTRRIAAFYKKGKLRLSMPSVKQRADMADSLGNSGLFSAYGKDTEHSEVVDADRLDDIVDRRVDLLKIDVEGSEAAVLDGADRIMTQDRPVLFIELRATTMAMAGHGQIDYSRYFKDVEYVKVANYIGDAIMVPKEKT